MQNVTTLSVSLSKMQPQAWLASAFWDGLWIISPAFVSTACVLLFRSEFAGYDSMPLWAWVCFVLLIDVSHVYATIYRTYLSKRAFTQNKYLLVAIPVACWAAGAMLYSAGEICFWRVLAYLAVFHFIRQQYGFVALYSRRDPALSTKFRWLDTACVYAAAVYPLLFWHTHLPRNFSWFVDGDFAAGLPEIFVAAGFTLYVLLMGGYVLKEIVVASKTRFFNIPRNLIIAGTALSWWVGIITLNSDMAFTITNVVTHGIPYMALSWFYRERPDHEALSDLTATNKIQLAALSNVLIFLGIMVFLAYLEEGLWDGFIWREHLSFFAPFANLTLVDDKHLLAILIPLLALPQSTHYVLDGFIWRVKKQGDIWSVKT